MDKLGVGIVGAGLIGRVHAEALAGIGRAELQAVYNRNIERGKALADQFNVPWYDDYDRFLARDDLDVIIICTPSGTHADFAISAAEAGKHLIVEKPLEIVNVLQKRNFPEARRRLCQHLDNSKEGCLPVPWNKDAHDGEDTPLTREESSIKAGKE